MKKKANEIDRLLRELENETTCVNAAFELSRIDDGRAFNGLITALRHPAPKIRSCAVMALAETADKRATEHLILLLHDPDIGVRSSAAFALGKIGDPKSVPALVAALWRSFDVDAHLARQLLVALVDIDERQATRAILPALESAIPEVRATTAEFLGHIGDRDSRTVLAESLRQEDDPHVRKAIEDAIRTLEQKYR